MITFHSLTDREAIFKVLLKQTDKLFYEKDYVARTPEIQTLDKFALEKRAYGMFDSIVKTILDDPDFANSLR